MTGETKRLVERSVHGRVMPIAILSMYGTGRAGSLTYSSNAALGAAAASDSESPPPAWKWMERGVAAA